MTQQSRYKKTWFMTSSHCPVSGLPVLNPELYICPMPGSNYIVEMAKLGDRIFLVKASGYVRSAELTEALKITDAYRHKYFKDQRGLVLVEDYTDVRGAETGARKQYFDYYKNQELFIAGILYNMSTLFKISYNLAKRLDFVGEPVFAVDNYSQAIDIALQIIDQTSPVKARPDDVKQLSIKIPNRFSFYSSIQDLSKLAVSGPKKQLTRLSLKLGSWLNKRLSQQIASLLLEFIQSIDWQKDGARPPIPPKYGDEEIGKVFDAISYIKYEIDRLISDHMTADQELKKSEARYRQLVEHAKAGIFQLNRDTGRIENFNEAFLEIFGYTAEEMQALTVNDLLTEESLKVYNQRLQRLLSGEMISSDVIYQALTKNGDVRWILINTSQNVIDGRLGIANVVLSDITELKRIEIQFLEYQAKLKSLSIQLSKTQENERRQLASRLHDSISQELFAAHLQLNALEKKMGESPQQREVRQIKNQVHKVIKDTKTLTFDLSPPVLYDFGLREAVVSLAAAIEEKHEIKIKTWFSGDLDEIGDEIKIIIYRIVSELMHNTVKHAKAHEIRISLNNTDHLMTIDFEDDGIGFDTERLNAGAVVYTGFGIFDIQEKLNHLGGQLVIDSKPGAGTSIMMEVPLDVLAN